MRFSQNVFVSNDKYELWYINDETLGLVLKNSRKLTKLNEILKQYPEDTEFQLQDEPVFKIKFKDCIPVERLTGLKLNQLIIVDVRGV
jgi:hypothetical protein